MGGTPEPLYTPQPLPGFPSPAAMEGELVNRQTGRRMFTEDLLGQPMEVRGRRDPAADLGIRYPYAKAYTQREAVEFERLASTSRISDADRADYEAWLAGKVPETDAERHRREFVYDQIDIFRAAIHGGRSGGNPNRWDITPEEGLSQFEQLIRWIKGEDTFPQNIRTARWENFWTEMKDAKAGQTITEADLADMDRTTRDLYEEWASQLNEMEAATEMSKLKKMLQFNRIWGTGNPDPPKRSAREAMDLWDAFINWGKDRGEYQYHMMDGNVEQMFFQHMDMNHTRRDAVGKVTKRGWETGLEVLALWRALRSSYDLGWHFRQGLIMGANNPRAWAKAWGPAIKSLRNEETATAAEALLRNDPLIRRATTEFWDEPLFIAERGAPWQERDIRAAEQYTSVWAGKIPGIPASERAFTVAGNLTRMQALIDIATRWESVGPGNRVTRVIDNFFGVGEDVRGTPMSDDELHDVIKLVNRATGRGSWGAKEGTEVARLVNRIMYSPRLFFSRFQTPLMLFSRSPRVRKEAARALTRFWGLFMSVLGILKLGSLAQDNVRVDTDPNSPTFARLQVGRQDFDLSGGHQSLFRYLTQFVTGHSRASGRSELRKVDRADTALRMIRSKLSPFAGEVWNEVAGDDFVGNKIQRPTSLPGVYSTVDRIIFHGLPMTLIDIAEGFEIDSIDHLTKPLNRLMWGGPGEDPRPAHRMGRVLQQGALATLGSVAGFGVNTYVSVDDIAYEVYGIPYGGELWPHDRERALDMINKIERPQGAYSLGILEAKEEYLAALELIDRNVVERADGTTTRAGFRTDRAFYNAYKKVKGEYSRKKAAIAAQEFGAREGEDIDLDTIEDPKRRALAEYYQLVTEVADPELINQWVIEAQSRWDAEDPMIKEYVLSSINIGTELIPPMLREKIVRAASKVDEAYKLSEEARKRRNNQLLGSKRRADESYRRQEEREMAIR